MLTPADVDHFRRQLEIRGETLRQRIATLEQAVAAPGEWEDAALERGDDAVLLREHDDAWDRLAFSRDELARVQRALAQIDAGTYGISEVSGKPIPRERLEAEPTATTLVDETPPDSRE